MRLVIGFGNKARHGKDGAALSMIDHLESKRAVAKHHNYPVRTPNVLKIGFADALRRESSAAISKAGRMPRYSLPTTARTRIPPWSSWDTRARY